MPVWEPWDAFDIGLGGLRTYDADPERVERIRARCLAALMAQRQKERARRLRFNAWRRRLEPALALGLSALYLAAAVSGSLALLQK
jgi:hypothetical protein